MRTNIELDDDLLRKARKYSSAKTKRALVEEALVNFIETNEHRRRVVAWDKRVQEIRKKTSKIRLDKSSVDIIREDRNRDD